MTMLWLKISFLFSKQSVSTEPKDARLLIDEYIQFYNNERIQRKSKPPVQPVVLILQKHTKSLASMLIIIVHDKYLTFLNVKQQSAFSMALPVYGTVSFQVCRNSTGTFPINIILIRNSPIFAISISKVLLGILGNIDVHISPLIRSNHFYSATR